MEQPGDAALSELIRGHATRHAPSEALAARIRAALPGAASALEPKPRDSVRPSQERRGPWQRWLEAAALYGAGALTAWVAASVLWLAPAPVLPDVLQDEVVASHVRSLLADHLSDVRSSDHHTVKPWFAGKLDFSPPVIDLAPEGFALTGGRLDYLDGRPVAALVYARGPHVINLFVWPAATGQGISVPRFATERGYNVAQWTAAGMRAWAVSDVDAGELRAFAQLASAAMGR
ncbi:MAG: hypothetical protein JWQ73_734 [Variovorax sp.]|nr:hypothetical protein [Variovorax sp.]